MDNYIERLMTSKLFLWIVIHGFIEKGISNATDIISQVRPDKRRALAEEIAERSRLRKFLNGKSTRIIEAGEIPTYENERDSVIEYSRATKELLNDEDFMQLLSEFVEEKQIKIVDEMAVGWGQHLKNLADDLARTKMLPDFMSNLAKLEDEVYKDEKEQAELKEEEDLSD